jgi:hypothetical protein
MRGFLFCVLIPFEVLHGFFVLLCRGKRFERAQIPSLARLRILLPRVQSVTAGLKFPDHGNGLLRHF